MSRSKKSIGWKFPGNNFGTEDGFNDGAIDHFKASPLSSLVREIIQNSLDAGNSNNLAVNVAFDLFEEESNSFNGFGSIEKSLSYCSKEVKKGSREYNYYQKGIKSSKKSIVKILAIHDFNTHGLTEQHFVPLVKGKGKSGKMGKSSLGSFGHGSTAPFPWSETSSVFYYSLCNEEGSEVKKFQGKSILQSHFNEEHCQIGDDGNKELTQGSGFYGYTEQLQKITNDHEIPAWAKLNREKFTDNTGTSVYIPHVSFDRGLFPETKIVALTSFFIPILNGRLELNINGEIINKDNVVDGFKWCLENWQDEQDKIDVSQLKGAFESIKTFLNPDHSGEFEAKDFGLVRWYLRLDSDENPITEGRAVGIARQVGMLITRKPRKLEKFPSLKMFDCFCHVVGDEGSEILKSFENPAHNELSSERLNDDMERKRDYEAKYDNFAKKLREKIKEHAQFSSGDEQEIEELSEFFNIQGDDEQLSDGSDFGTEHKLSKATNSTESTHHITENNESDGGDETPSGPGNETNNGDGGSGGSKPRPDGTDITTSGQQKGRKIRLGKSFSPDHLRRLDFNKKRVLFKFCSPEESGSYDLEVFKKGRSINEKLIFKNKGSRSSSNTIEIKDKIKKCSVDLIFNEEVDKYKLELTLTKKR